MDHKNNGNPMDRNISNVFLPHRRIHVSEQEWDVDFAEVTNRRSAAYDDDVYPGRTRGEIGELDDINKDDTLM